MVAPLVVGELLACLYFSEFVPIVLRLRSLPLFFWMCPNCAWVEVVLGGSGGGSVS